ncbi:MAG: DUF2195 family protein [Alteromonadales bacterium]|nr:DUF2195 family protein [Alteromonadales bacterium]
MAELRYSLLSLFLISACSQATSTTKITINNNLSNCIKIENTKVVYKDGMPMLEVSHQKIKSTSECGCKSAISEYSSQLEMDGYNSPLLNAKLIFEARNFEVPLATTKKMIGDFNVLVSFSCALPD